MMGFLQQDTQIIFRIFSLNSVQMSKLVEADTDMEIPV